MIDPMDVGVEINEAYCDGFEAGVKFAKPGWISVDDRLPQEHEMVLCYTPVDDYICVGFVRKYEWGSKTLLKWNIVTAMRSTKILTKKVTHWMSLPDAPKEENV